MPGIYRPIVAARTKDYHGAALVGTHSTVIGWNVNDADLRTGLLGSAIRRYDTNSNTGISQSNWLGGYKRFQETDEGTTENVGSNIAPFQRFRWNDYTLRPDHTYKYKVFPVRGTPTALSRDEAPVCGEFLFCRINPRQARVSRPRTFLEYSRHGDEAALFSGILQRPALPLCVER